MKTEFLTNLVLFWYENEYTTIKKHLEGSQVSPSAEQLWVNGLQWHKAQNTEESILHLLHHVESFI